MYASNDFGSDLFTLSLTEEEDKKKQEEDKKQLAFLTGTTLLQDSKDEEDKNKDSAVDAGAIMDIIGSFF